MITMEPLEALAASTIKHVGAQNSMWAADYPHSDGHWNSVAAVKETLSELSEPERRQVLGENAVNAYQL
jgi:predicted TIM-barrel fold metal-dependent hydrolase